MCDGMVYMMDFKFVDVFVHVGSNPVTATQQGNHQKYVLRNICQFGQNAISLTSDAECIMILKHERHLLLGISKAWSTNYCLLMTRCIRVWGVPFTPNSLIHQSELSKTGIRFTHSLLGSSIHHSLLHSLTHSFTEREYSP